MSKIKDKVIDEINRKEKRLVEKLIQCEATLNLIFSKTENINHGLIMKMEETISIKNTEIRNIKKRISHYRSAFNSVNTIEQIKTQIRGFTEEFPEVW